MWLIILQELKQYIDEYTMIYDPTDEDDWRLVVNEVTAFIDVSFLMKIDHKTSLFSSPTVGPESNLNQLE